MNNLKIIRRWTLILFLSLIYSIGPAEEQWQDCLIWPISGEITPRADTITSPYGIRKKNGKYDFHRGIDLRTRIAGTPSSVPINASYDGYVRREYYDIEFKSGLCMEVFHIIMIGNSSYFLNFKYAHLDIVYPWEFPVASPAFDLGDTIGMTGKTETTIHHLHLGCQYTGAATWDGSRTTRNLNEYFTLPYLENTSPILSDITSTHVGDSLEKINMKIKIDSKELDHKQLHITMAHPILGLAYEIDFYLSLQSVQSFVTDGLNVTNADSLGYHEHIKQDSLFEFFVNDTMMSTNVILFAESFDPDTSQYFVLDLEIDPQYYYYSKADSAYITAFVEDFNGNKAYYYLYYSPNSLLDIFSVSYDGEYISINYGPLQKVYYTQQFDIRRLTPDGMLDKILLTTKLRDSEGALQVNASNLVDTTANPIFDYLYEAVLIHLDGSEQVIASLKYTGLPDNFSLSPNYPNPFNMSTAIEFSINSKKSVQASLVIYNTLGQKVNVLHDGLTSPGNYTKYWDGTNSQGGEVATGTYFYRLRVGEQTKSKKMILIK